MVTKAIETCIIQLTVQNTVVMQNTDLFNACQASLLCSGNSALHVFNNLPKSVLPHGQSSVLLI